MFNFHKKPSAIHSNNSKIKLSHFSKLIMTLVAGAFLTVSFSTSAEAICIKCFFRKLFNIKTFCYVELPMMEGPPLTVMAPCDAGFIEGLGVDTSDNSNFDLVSNVRSAPLIIGGEGRNEAGTMVLLPDNVLLETSFNRGRLVVDTGAWWVEGDAIMLGNVRGEAEIVLVQGDTASEIDLQGGGHLMFCYPKDFKAGKCREINATVNTQEGEGNVVSVDAPASAQVWTDWLNRDTPGGSGDFETVKDFLAAGKIDPNPVAIQCRTRDGKPWQAAGQTYTCDVNVGGVCRNADQSKGRCLDYEVRFRYKKVAAEAK